MTPPFVYLSQGKLHRHAGEQAQALESAFGRSLRDRAAQIHDRHAWKRQGSGAMFMYGLSGRGGGGGHDPGEFRIAITGVCAGREPGSLYYTLETDQVGGIFSIDAEGREDRLLHTADYRPRHIALRRPEGAELAVSVSYPDGSANLGLLRTDGGGLREVTEGESADLAPAWAPGPARKLVFQSAGLGRNQAGHLMRLGPASLQSLDLESGELATLAEEPGADLLTPRLLADGTLLYIRRPHVDPASARVSPWGMLKDTVMMPFRISFAVFQFFNFFSMRYTGKPLTTDQNGAAQREPDWRQLMIQGNLIDADRAAREADRSDGDAPSIVPASWQLMRRAPGASRAETLARGVLSFDVAADSGEVLYSNGSAVYRMQPSGRERERVWKSALIEHVAAVN